MKAYYATNPKPKKAETKGPAKAAEKAAEKSFAEQVVEKATPFLNDKHAWTDKEAAEKEERLAAALSNYFEYADQGLGYLKKRPVVIWSNMDAEDCGIIAKVLCRRAKKSPELAAMLDLVMEEELNIQFLVLVVPRLIETGGLFMPDMGSLFKMKPKPQKAQRIVVDAAPA